MSVTKAAKSGSLVALTLCTSIDLLDMIWYSNLRETENQSHYDEQTAIKIQMHQQFLNHLILTTIMSDTHAANKPMKSIQLAIENVPPSSVFLFLTTF